MSWQPLADALSSWWVKAALMLCLFVALFGQERVATWIEGIGQEGVARLVAATR